MRAVSREKPKISRRQRVLLQRLQTVGDRALEVTLPLRIEAIYVFGSFLRAKEKPGDLDMVLQYSHFEPIYDRFRELMKVAEKLHFENPSQYSAPKDAIRAAVLGGSDERNWPILARWIEGYSWDMINRWWQSPTSWDVVTRRVLLRKVSRAHISDFVEKPEDLEKKGHTAKALEKVWSREEPDVEANLLKILAPTRVGKNIILEIENFEKQLERRTLEIRVAEALYHTILPIKPEVFPDRWVEFLASKAVELFPTEKKEVVEYFVEGFFPIPLKQVEIGLTVDMTPYLTMRLESLQELAEKKRDQLRKVGLHLEVMKSVLRNVVSWKGGILERDEYLSRLAIEDWVSRETLRDIPKKVVDEARIREVLRGLGLPEHKVLTVKGRGRAWYDLARNEGDRARVALGNAIQEAATKYRRQLRPVVTQTNKELELHVEVGQDLRPEFVNIWWHITREGKSAQEFERALAWCSERGFKIAEHTGVSIAQVYVALNDCKDIEEMKARLLNKLTSGVTAHPA